VWSAEAGLNGPCMACRGGGGCGRECASREAAHRVGGCVERDEGWRAAGGFCDGIASLEEMLGQPCVSVLTRAPLVTCAVLTTVAR
jgi:hypothetical protein